jgi:hypothetical protein
MYFLKGEYQNSFFQGDFVQNLVILTIAIAYDAGGVLGVECAPA